MVFYCDGDLMGLDGQSSLHTSSFASWLANISFSCDGNVMKGHVTGVTCDLKCARLPSTSQAVSVNKAIRAAVSWSFNLHWFLVGISISGLTWAELWATPTNGFMNGGKYSCCIHCLEEEKNYQHSLMSQSTLILIIFVDLYTIKRLFLDLLSHICTLIFVHPLNTRVRAALKRHFIISGIYFFITFFVLKLPLLMMSSVEAKWWKSN